MLKLFRYANFPSNHQRYGFVINDNPLRSLFTLKVGTKYSTPRAEELATGKDLIVLSPESKDYKELLKYCFTKMKAFLYILMNYSNDFNSDILKNYILTVNQYRVLESHKKKIEKQQKYLKRSNNLIRNIKEKYTEIKQQYPSKNKQTKKEKNVSYNLPIVL